MDIKEKYIGKIKNDFCTKKVIVIGDIMVDEYITGKVKRISPEAPVPILDYRDRTLEAGGASNVANNMKKLGADVTIIGIVGEDKAGEWIKTYFKTMDIHTEYLLSEDKRPTTVKTRYATKGQQLLRVDNEDASGIGTETKKKILEILSLHINECDAVVLSDYKKGVFSDDEFVQSIIKMCNDSNILVSIDSKSRNIKAFKNADFVKPNNLELEDAVGIHIDDDNSLNAAGYAYLETSGAKALVVTRGKNGISVFEPNKNRQDFPAKDVQVYDVCGAGDTVISTISMGLASGLELCDSVKLANIAAGVVITKVGTVPITSEELLRSINGQ